MSDNILEINEQLAFMDRNQPAVSVGRVIRGTIISVSDKAAYVNIGYKSDAYLPLSEVSKQENVKLNELFKIGEEIEAKVISRSNEDGYVVLSRIEIERDSVRKDIKAAYDNKSSITVLIKEAVSGGLVGSFGGVRIFIPASHVEIYHVGNLEEYIGKNLEVKLIEYKEDRRGTKLVASRKDLLKAEKEKTEELAWETIETGTKVKGKVKRLTDFGAFVDVNGIDGLLHVSEMSWGKIDKPGNMLSVGQDVEVYILDADKENKKLSLSIKRLLENPWINVEVKYPIGNIALGKVVRFTNFGAFVELEPGVDGLVHISQIGFKRIANPSEVLNIGDMVKAKIVSVDSEKRRIGLSIKEVEEV